MNDLQQVITNIIKGDVVVIPTENSYALVADPFNKDALDKLFIKLEAFKSDDMNNDESKKDSLAILVGDIEDLPRLISDLDENAQSKIINHWPGSSELLFSKPSHILDKRLLNEDKTLALRLPQSDYVLEILHSIGQPLACINLTLNDMPVKTTRMVQFLDLFVLKLPVNFTSQKIQKVKI